MNGGTLIKILTSSWTKKWFQGISTIDLPLPISNIKPALFILNTDTSNGPGEHWCAVLILNNSICEFFDPYGKSPEIYGFETILLNVTNNIKYNKKCVQGFLPTCGHHCIYFSIHRALGYSMNEIIQCFYTNDIQQNDEIVLDFMETKFNLERF